jgi:hypothetical protein
VGLDRVVTIVDVSSDDVAVVDQQRTAEGITLRVTAPAGVVQATPMFPERSASEPVDEQRTAAGQEVVLQVGGPQEPFVVLLEWFGDDGSLGLVELRVG